MTNRFEIEKTTAGLTFRSERVHPWWTRALSAAITGFVLYFIVSRYLSRPVSMLIAAILSGLVGFWQLRKECVELTVNRLEMKRTGHFRGGNLVDSVVPLADIQRLEFRPGSDGDTFEARGMYVKHGWSSTCMLPNITGEQCAAAIESIERRFPEIPYAPEKGLPSVLGDDIIRLNLSQPKQG